MRPHGQPHLEPRPLNGLLPSSKSPTTRSQGKSEARPSPQEDSFSPAASPLRPDGGSGALGVRELRRVSRPRSQRLQLPGGIAAAAAASTSLRHCRRPGKAARAGAGAVADPEAGADDGGSLAAPPVRRSRGAPPCAGAGAPRAPPLLPHPAVVYRDAEPGAAGGAARGERRGEGDCLLPLPSSPTGGPRQELGRWVARPS